MRPIARDVVEGGLVVQRLILLEQSTSVALMCAGPGPLVLMRRFEIAVGAARMSSQRRPWLTGRSNSRIQASKRRGGKSFRNATVVAPRWPAEFAGNWLMAMAVGRARRQKGVLLEEATQPLAAGAVCGEELGGG